LLGRTRSTIVGLDWTKPKIQPGPHQLVTVHEHSNQLHLACRDVHCARPAWQGKKRKQEGWRVYLEKPRSSVMASGGGGSRRWQCWWQLLLCFFSSSFFFVVSSRFCFPSLFFFLVMSKIKKNKKIYFDIFLKNIMHYNIKYTIKIY